MNDNIALPDRMLAYESETKIQFPSDSIIVARIDGRGFSKLTKNFVKPFDPNFTERMVDVTKALVEQTYATIGYTQSDEISLIWHTDNPNGQVFFNGKLQKLCSICASIATAAWNCPYPLGGITGLFDCRVFTVPSKSEAINYLIHRQRDCIRNSVSMAAHHHFGHKRLMNKGVIEQRVMLLNEADIRWSNYPTPNRIGTFVQRETYETLVDSVFAGEAPNKCTRSRVVALNLDESINHPDMYKIAFGEDHVED